MEEEQQRVDEATRSAASHEQVRREQVADAYQTVERLLVDAVGRRKPWTLVEHEPRLRTGWVSSLPEVAPVYGWAFPFPGVVVHDKYGIAVTVGGRVLLLHYFPPREKSAGSVSVQNGYPPHETWPLPPSSSGKGEALVRTGAKAFAQVLAKALVAGDEWHTPLRGRGNHETLPQFIERLPPALRFPQRRANAL
jgi:hypothetical protein